MKQYLVCSGELWDEEDLSPIRAVNLANVRELAVDNILPDGDWAVFADEARISPPYPTQQQAIDALRKLTDDLGISLHTVTWLEPVAAPKESAEDQS